MGTSIETVVDLILSNRGQTSYRAKQRSRSIEIVKFGRQVWEKEKSTASQIPKKFVRTRDNIFDEKNLFHFPWSRFPGFKMNYHRPMYIHRFCERLMCLLVF